MFIKKSELVLDLDAVEDDAMDDVEGIQEDERPIRNEDLFDYSGMAIDVGVSSPCDDGAEPGSGDEWDPLNFD
jgi:hypothetical protein